MRAPIIRGIPADKLAPRIIARIEKKRSGCWEWTGASDRRGYGRISLNKRCYLPHRVMWAHANGPIPLGMYVCHKCDNPRCVNPEHLFVGSAGDNQRDMARKGRARPWNGYGNRTHCVNGHPFNKENTRYRASNPKWRQCRVCDREKAAKRRGVA